MTMKRQTSKSTASSLSLIVKLAVRYHRICIYTTSTWYVVCYRINGSDGCLNDVNSDYAGFTCQSGLCGCQKRYHIQCVPEKCRAFAKTRTREATDSVSPAVLDVGSEKSDETANSQYETKNPTQCGLRSRVNEALRRPGSVFCTILRSRFRWRVLDEPEMQVSCDKSAVT